MGNKSPAPRLPSDHSQQKKRFPLIPVDVDVFARHFRQWTIHISQPRTLSSPLFGLLPDELIWHILLLACDDDLIPSILGVAPQISKRWAHLMTDESLWHRIGTHLGAITDHNESPPSPHPTWRSHVIDDLIWNRQFAHELRTHGKRVCVCDHESLGKVTLSGPERAGKSSLCAALQSKFETQYKPTIGVEFSLSYFVYNQRKIKMQLFDTAGNERFLSLYPIFHRGSQCSVMVFDLTSRRSFEEMPLHLESVGTSPAFLLVGTHLDECGAPGGKREVTTREARIFAAQHGMPYVETSARTGHNVDLVFLYAASVIAEHQVEQFDPYKRVALCKDEICY